MKKRVLICLNGLPRTFRKTAPLLFERIIEPNKDRYAFDIMINTDSKGVGLTCGRPDTMQTGISIYQPSSEEELINELMKAYNIPKSAISIYNFMEPKPVMSWFLTYKRIALILGSSKCKYDMYISMRLDTVVTRKIDLSNYENALVFCTTTGIRPCYFHERDMMDTAIIGSHDAFMKWVYTYNLCAKTILSTFPELVNFMPDNRYVDQEFIGNYLYEWINNKDDLEVVAERLGLKHTSDPWCAHIIINNTVQYIDILGVYGLSAADNLRNNLIKSLSIIDKTHKCILGEKINLYTEIIR